MPGSHPAKTSTLAWAVSESDHRAWNWQDLFEGFLYRDLMEAIIRHDPHLLPPHPWFYNVPSSYSLKT